MAIDTQPELQFIVLVQAFQRFTQQTRGGLNFAITTPEGIHAVGRIENKQDACGHPFIVCGNLS
jgi:hypothetical protein